MIFHAKTTHTRFSVSSNLCFVKCSDGLHLTHKGNKLVFAEVIKVLAEAQISTETLPADLPLISEIDPSDPLKLFEN